jgi:hypothetical protein
MTSISPRRTLAAALLLACLAFGAVPVQARPFGLDRPRAEEGFLLKMWSFAVGLFEKVGMSIDPDGQPEGNGSTTDPDGGTPDPGEEGMSIDPNG